MKIAVQNCLTFLLLSKFSGIYKINKFQVPWKGIDSSLLSSVATNRIVCNITTLTFIGTVSSLIVKATASFWNCFKCSREICITTIIDEDWVVSEDVNVLRYVGRLQLTFYNLHIFFSAICYGVRFWTSRTGHNFHLRSLTRSWSV